MASQVSHLGQSRVTPDGELVVGVAVTRDDFLVLLVPEEGRHLGFGVNSVDRSTGVDVPEVDASVSCTATGSKQVGLPWAPGESLDCGSVPDQRGAMLFTSFVPDVDNVVVGTGSQVFAVW